MKKYSIAAIHRLFYGRKCVCAAGKWTCTVGKCVFAVLHKRISPPHKRISLLQKRISLPHKRISLLQKRISPPRKRISPLQKRISLPHKRISPLHYRNSPFGLEKKGTF